MPHAAEDLARVQVVQAAELVVGTPLAPVAGGVVAEDLAHGRSAVGHRRPFVAVGRHRPVTDRWRPDDTVSTVTRIDLNGRRWTGRPGRMTARRRSGT
ncbi:hypothetical protein Ae706Ps2_4627 [Pseudonocardia sp. Ae706_Ps2]|nr:hypothetical protein Ae331Ps2_1324c [Pseudonocardia sp. Ae331_Ps2]OLM10544.1 hypothetical protein Ae505Ps2_0667c [Pseudonocardia sp. Ae505_Ps2]OLM26194.1 hypothetical protein Ae706Ps2_4627 [Pseudonocardia sp. Ae706_Ps2]